MIPKKTGVFSSIALILWSPQLPRTRESVNQHESSQKIKAACAWNRDNYTEENDKRINSPSLFRDNVRTSQSFQRDPKNDIFCALRILTAAYGVFRLSGRGWKMAMARKNSDTTTLLHTRKNAAHPPFLDELRSAFPDFPTECEWLFDFHTPFPLIIIEYDSLVRWKYLAVHSYTSGTENDFQSHGIWEEVFPAKYAVRWDMVVGDGLLLVSITNSEKTTVRCFRTVFWNAVQFFRLCHVVGFIRDCNLKMLSCIDITQSALFLFSR